LKGALEEQYRKDCHSITAKLIVDILENFVILETSFFVDVLVNKDLAGFFIFPFYRLEGIDKQYIYKLIVGLQRKGIIKRVEKGRYTLVDPLFKEYLKLREEGEI